MNYFDYNVLLYSDGSHQALSAAVYTAILLKKTPNMHLTILQIQSRDEALKGTEYNWMELRPKYKQYHWGCSTGAEHNWINIWPVCPTSGWMKGVFDESSLEVRKQYYQIIDKTNEIFSKKKFNVKFQTIFFNTSVADNLDTSEKVDAILEYATENSFKLIIMGTRGLSTLKGLIFGSLAHKVLDKSPLPVLLIKKLPQEFINSYLSDDDPELIVSKTGKLWNLNRSQ